MQTFLQMHRVELRQPVNSECNVNIKTNMRFQYSCEPNKMDHVIVNANLLQETIPVGNKQRSNSISSKCKAPIIRSI